MRSERLIEDASVPFSVWYSHLVGPCGDILQKSWPISTYCCLVAYDCTHWGWTGAPSNIGTTTQSLEQIRFPSKIALPHPTSPRSLLAQDVSLDTPQCGMWPCYHDTHLQWAGATRHALMATESLFSTIFSFWNRPVLTSNSCARCPGRRAVNSIVWDKCIRLPGVMEAAQPPKSAS